jgi:DnaA family protein
LSQLALPLKLQDHAVFESFWPAGNEALVAFLSAIATTGDGPGGWLWGAAASGKTHLLQAVCETPGDRAVFLPLRDFVDVGPAILEGLASRQFICLDDVDVVAGDADWELGLFNLYNQVSDADGVLVVSAIATPRACNFSLADLASRFSRLPAFHVHALDEDELISALQLRARHRGLDLPLETASFLLTRMKRDMASLYAMLDKLDTAALKAKRRLTVPFVKEVLEQTV